MRSSKSRSRSKSNRPRSIGNIINRVFDSSGPEGKVRGTPQQIIEKYQFLARDAQLSNDRVAAENFMQHAEHYTRMLAEAQRELAAEQDQRRPQDYVQNGGQNSGQTGQPGYQGNQGGQSNPGNQGGYSQGGYSQGGQPQGSNQQRDRSYGSERPDPRDEPQPDVGPVRSASMMDFIEDITDSSLVETPETRRVEQPVQQRTDYAERRDRGPKPERTEPQQERRQDRRDDRKPRGDQPPRPARDPQADTARHDAPAPVQPAVQDATSPAAEAAPAAPKKPRAPRKPRSNVPDGGSSGPAEAAE
jgi:hypothetical protein